MAAEKPRIKHSAIYQGGVRHRRFHPKKHEFSYQSTLFYIDLDELPELFENVRGWSLNRKNLGSFCRRDYLGDPDLPLKEVVQKKVVELVGYCPLGAVRMLTNLRIWGFCFNPVTFYYVFEPDANFPSFLLAEVNNTPWNERHCYLVPCDPVTGKTKAQFEKKFHVSPFNPLDMDYHWVSGNPADHLLVHMENHAKAVGETGDTSLVRICHMDATLNLTRHAWSASLLKKMLWQQPWAAIKIPITIYWEAFRLFFKGTPVYSHHSINTFNSDPSSDPHPGLKATGNKS